jgi:hypothetical protein
MLETEYTEKNRRLQVKRGAPAGKAGWIRET